MDSLRVRVLGVVGCLVWIVCALGYLPHLAVAADVPTTLEESAVHAAATAEPNQLVGTVDLADDVTKTEDDPEPPEPLTVPEESKLDFSLLDAPPECSDEAWVYFHGYGTFDAIWEAVTQLYIYGVDEVAAYAALTFFESIRECQRADRRFERLENRLDDITAEIAGLRTGDPLPVEVQSAVELESLDTASLEAAVIDDGNASRSVMWGGMGFAAAFVVLFSIYRLFVR